MPTTQNDLTTELNAWCDANGLPHDSTEELRWMDLTPEQHAWLTDFEVRWDTLAD